MGKISELLGIPLGWVMYGIYQIVNNYGISIIIFTLLTRLIMLPVSYKQQLGNVRTQALNPKLNQLRKQYANNPQKFQEEQQKLYAQEGINPMGGCMPLIVTMIILYGVLDVVYRPLTHIMHVSSDFLNKAKEIILDKELLTENVLRSRPELSIMQQIKEHPDFFRSIGGNSDIVDKIVAFKNSFLGVPLDIKPTIHPDVWNKTAFALILIPIFSGLTQLLSTLYTQYRSKKMNPDAPKMQGAGCMNIMLYGMPIFSVWLAFSVPAGVGFYWIWSAVFSFIQMVLLYAYFTPKRMEAINAKLKEKNKNKKPGFMQRMMEQQNELMNASGTSRDYYDKIQGMSRSEKQNYNSQLINESRKHMEEKYNDAPYNDDDEQRIIKTRKRMAEKYGDVYDEDDEKND